MLASAALTLYYYCLAKLRTELTRDVANNLHIVVCLLTVAQHIDPQYPQVCVQLWHRETANPKAKAQGVGVLESGLERTPPPPCISFPLCPERGGLLLLR